MKEEFYISAYTEIANRQIIVNGKVVFSNIVGTLASFLKDAFKNIQVDYPKFYKMDNLSKLAFTATEYLLKGMPEKQDTAVVLANKSGSLDTDLRHWSTIADQTNYYPSPAVFVYTLANICIGELCIRHDLLSENTFFVSDCYDAVTQHTYTEYLLLSGKAERVLCGWVEVFGEEYRAVLYTVERNGTKPHTVEQIDQLFLI